MQKVTGAIAAHDLPVGLSDLVAMHPPCAIHDNVEYENALEIIEALSTLPELSPGQAGYLETLAILVHAYEAKNIPMDVSGLSPIDTLRHLMEARDMSASDLGRLLGERSLGPKVLNGDRALSKTHIRALADYFRVPADLFL